MWCESSISQNFEILKCSIIVTFSKKWLLHRYLEGGLWSPHRSYRIWYSIGYRVKVKTHYFILSNIISGLYMTDLVFSVEIQFGLIPYPLTLAPYPLSLIPTPCSFAPSTVPFKKFSWVSPAKSSEPFWERDIRVKILLRARTLGRIFQYVVCE